MKKYKNYKVLIPLRGGSKGIKKKNLKLFKNKPLYTWCARAAIQADLEVIISTECDEIKNSIKHFFPNLEIQDRPLELATDQSSTEDVIDFFIKSYFSENIILLQATSPQTTSKDILEAIKCYENGNYKPLVSGTREHKFIWSNDGRPYNYNTSKRPRRQDWEGSFIENGAIYIFRRKDFERFGTRCKEPCTLFEMDEINNIEIDNINEFKTLENKIKQLKN